LADIGSKPARVVAVVNQKGGTAKTTTAVNLGAALAERGQRVLLIDMDPQGSATEWLGYSPTSMDLAEVLTEGRPLGDVARSTVVDGLELVPASRALTIADRQLSGEPGIQTVLRDALAALPRRDVVLIDCPPALGLLVVMSLAAAHEVLVPVAAASMELAGLAELLRTIDKVKERLNPQLRLSAVLASRVDVRGLHTSRIASDVLASLRRRFPSQMLEAVIHENVRLREAPSHHQPITLYDPNGVAARDYRAAATELMDLSEVTHVVG
jgi:chromosome partitioning protein